MPTFAFGAKRWARRFFFLQKVGTSFFVYKRWARRSDFRVVYFSGIVVRNIPCVRRRVVGDGRFTRNVVLAHDFHWFPCGLRILAHDLHRFASCKLKSVNATVPPSLKRWARRFPDAKGGHVVFRAQKVGTSDFVKKVGTSAKVGTLKRWARRRRAHLFF